MRWLMPTVLLLAAACAPAAESPLQTPTQTPAHIEQTGGGYEVRLNSSGQPIGEVVAAAPDKVWPLAVDAYARAGLRIDGSDPVKHMLQTRGQIMRRRLNDRGLSSYFDCGSELSGNIADTWRLKVDAQMAVSPGLSGDSSHVVTMLTIAASPVEGTSNAITQCSSKGLLEGAIARYVREALQQH